MINIENPNIAFIHLSRGDEITNVSFHIKVEVINLMNLEVLNLEVRNPKISIVEIREPVEMRDLEMNVAEVGETSHTMINICEVSRGFAFPRFHMSNPKIVVNLIDERKAQTYIKCYRRSFVHDPTDSKIRWCIEVQSHTHDHNFLSIDRNPKMV